jgi:hypothetical protein
MAPLIFFSSLYNYELNIKLLGKRCFRIALFIGMLVAINYVGLHADRLRADSGLAPDQSRRDRIMPRRQIAGGGKVDVAGPLGTVLRGGEHVNPCRRARGLMVDSHSQRRPLPDLDRS